MNRGNLAEDPKAGLSSSSRYSRDGGEKNSLLYVDSSAVRKERRAAERRAGKAGIAISGNHNSKGKKSVGRGLTDSHMDRLEVGSDGRLFQVKENTAADAASRQSTQSTAPAQNPEKHMSASGSVPGAVSVRKKPVISDKTAARVEEADGAASGIDTARRKSDANGIRPAITERILTKQQEEALTARQEEKSSVTNGQQDGMKPGPQEEIHPQQQDGSAKTGQMSKPDRDYLSKGNPLLKLNPPATAEGSTPSGGARGFIRRFRIPIIAGVLAAASVVYGYTAWHYRNRFYPGTEFFGIPAAEMSVYDVKAAVKAKVDSYSLELITRKPPEEKTTNVSEDNIITAGDVGMTYRDNGEIDRAMKNQKVWAWPVMMIAQMIGKGDSVLETSYQDQMASDAVDRLPCMQKENMIAPQDAQVILTDDGATVKTEVYGTTLNAEKTHAAVRNALDKGTTRIDLDDLGLYENPKVFSSDLSLMTEAMAMNKVLGAKVLMRFGSRTEVMNSEVIADFLDKKGSSYVLNEEKLREYVSKLAQKYDTCLQERIFYTSIGTKMTLEAGVGDYGWILDQEATYEKLLEAIRGQKKITMDPVYTQEAYCRDANDIGDTYVEISLTNQTMWFYKKGRLVVETPVVTGNPYAGHETPSGGVWSLKGRMRNQTLSGQGYSTPVDYWMPFNGGVGIHDLQSRAWFGGSIYLGGGSHGCINTPLSAVKLIYDQIEEGVPVIVYKDESEKALSLVTGPTDVQTANAQIEETFGTVEDDGIGSIVSWSRSQRWQPQAASAGTTAS